MKTRLLFVFMLFVAMIVDAEEVTDYGFMIEGNRINSSNYQRLSNGQAWSYDPTTNVLHLKDGTLFQPSDDDEPTLLRIYGDINPTLNIQVDGNIKLQGNFRRGIAFWGDGTHTISGNGTLNIQPEKLNAYGINSRGETKLTIKDITVNIKTYGDNATGFYNHGFSEILLEHCEMYIKAGFAAWYRSSSWESVQPILKSCYLESGQFVEGAAVNDAGNAFLTEMSIKRRETMDVNQFNITVQDPIPGTVVNKDIHIDNTKVLVDYFAWDKIDDDNHSITMREGDVFEEGYTYMAVIRLAPKSREWEFTDVIDVTLNGHPLTVETDFVNALVLYKFNHYNLMVLGEQVTGDNKDNILGASFDPSTNTLTLNNFYLDTQEEYEWGINNNNDMSTFDYDIDVKNLTIKLKGNNTIRTESACLYFKDVNLTIEGPGKLNLTSWGMDAINVKNSTLTLDHAKVYAKGKVSALNGTGSAMTVNNSLLEASSANETQATIRGFTSFQMTDSFFEDVYDDHDQIFYSDYMYYDNSGYYIYYDGVYGIDEGFDQSYYDNPYVGKVIISPAKSSISTNINEAYGQRESVKGQKDERYNLSGQRVGKDYKGIVIINGVKTVVK